MTKTAYFFLVLMFGFLVLSCGQWKETGRTEKSSEGNYFAGAFSEDSIVGVGFDGQVTRYDTGELVWQPGENESMCLFGLEGINAETYIACGNNSRVSVTKDGGRNWERKADFGADEPYHCRFASFSGETVGWIASDRKIGETENLGTSWREIPFDTDTNGYIAGICNMEKNTGFVMTVKGNLFYTENGGKSWEKRAEVIDPKEVPMRNDFTRFKPTLQIRMKGEKGLLVFANETNDGYNLNIYNTKDGGKTWTAEKPIPHTQCTVYINPDMSLISTLNSDTTVSLFKK